MFSFKNKFYGREESSLTKYLIRSKLTFLKKFLTFSYKIATVLVTAYVAFHEASPVFYF